MHILCQDRGNVLYGGGRRGGGEGVCALRLAETFWQVKTFVSECLKFN